MITSILFLPGAGADPAFWIPVANLLPQEWHKVRLSWPGLGHNPPVPDVSGFDDLVNWAAGKLPPGPTAIVAQSYGGAIALALSLKYPERVRALVLCATTAGMDVSAWGAEDWRPQYRTEYPRAAEWLYTARPNFEAQFSYVAQPTLLIWGDADPVSPVAVGKHLQFALPHAELRVIAGGTHAFAFERAPEVAGLIHTHLSTS